MHKFSCANLSRVVFPKLSLLRETKQVLPLPSQDALGTSELCCPFLCHTQQISVHTVTHTAHFWAVLCSKTCLLSLPIPCTRAQFSRSLSTCPFSPFPTHILPLAAFLPLPPLPPQLQHRGSVHWGCRIHSIFPGAA